MNRAVTYAALGRYARTRNRHEEARRLRRAKLGPNHPATALSRYSLACVEALRIPKASDRPQQAERALAWLPQAVAAGFKDVAQIEQDHPSTPCAAGTISSSFSPGCRPARNTPRSKG